MSSMNQTSSPTENKSKEKRPRQNPGPACQQCRARKLRCDRQEPCSCCLDAGVECYTTTTRPQRGPKRGHLKVLRSRVAALERRIGDQDDSGRLMTPPGIDDDFDEGHGWDVLPISQGLTPPIEVPCSSDCSHQLPAVHKIEETKPLRASGDTIPPLTRADLDQLYFDRTHSFVPIIQQARYFRRSKLPVPPDSHRSLQHAMWTMAAALSSQFQHLRHILYARTLEQLRSLEAAEFPDESEDARLDQAKAWILITIYEFMQDTIQRAWASSGRAIRLVQLLKLNRLDDTDANLDAGFGVHPDILVKKEEKRRTFWMAFCLDRFSCALDGLPLTLTEQLISTRLPSPESAFQSGIPIVMPFLLEVMTGSDTNILSPFVECIVFSALWGRGLAHQQHATVEHIYGDVSSEFWQRQLTLDDTLSRRLQQLQRNYPQASINADSMLLFTIMMVQATTLSLCSVAESISSSVEGSASLVSEYQQRAQVSVKEVAQLSKHLMHFNLFKYGFVPLAQIIIMPETYPATILARKTKTLQQKRGNMALQCNVDAGLSERQIFARVTLRSAKMTVLSPINLFLSVASAYVNGPSVSDPHRLPCLFQTVYGFSAQTVGLSFIGYGLGNLVGLVAFSATSDRSVRKRAAENRLRAEHRLPPSLIAGPLMALGSCSLALVGAGNVLFSSAVLGCLIDAFTEHSASAVAANTVFRSFGATLVPLVGPDMFAALGLRPGQFAAGIDYPFIHRGYDLPAGVRPRDADEASTATVVFTGLRW
ncbi:hypothetical protein DL768_010853 [Monosporascus sp. mg162]|nr:hypothetical protein DL768_010853 [Monosporascus sp. mg162]